MSSDPETERRLAALEERLARIEALLAAAPSAAKPDGGGHQSPTAPKRPAAAGRSPVSPKPPPLPAAERNAQLATSGEAWLARIGILLLIAGLAFFLKLSFDRGWISPPFRLLLSTLAGLGLVVAGEWFRSHRRNLAHALAGGGIAFLFGTVFAAYFLYGYLAPLAAFVLTVAIAAACFWQSVRCDSSALATLAAIGGLSTPLLLASPDVPVWSIGTQTAIVFLAAAAIYLVRGWRWFLGITLALSFFLLLLGTAYIRPSGQAAWEWLSGNLVDGARALLSDVSTPGAGGWLQGSVAIVALGATVSVAWRRLRDPKDRRGFADGVILLAPLAFLFITDALWHFPSNDALGLLAVALATVWAAAGLVLTRWQRESDLGPAFGASAAALACIAPPLFFEMPLAVPFMAVLLFAFAFATRKVRSRLQGIVLLLIAATVAGSTLQLAWRLALHDFGEAWFGPFSAGAFGASVFIALAPILRKGWAIGLSRWLGYGLLLLVSVSTTSWFDSGAAATVAVLSAIALGTRWLDARSGRAEAEILSYLLFSLAFIGLALALIGIPSPRLPFLNLDGLLLVASTAALAGAGWGVRLWKATLPPILLAIAAVIGHEFRDFHFGEWVSILWALFGAAVVTYGVRARSSYILFCGFGLLALTLARLILVDLAALDPAGKAVVFAAVGALLLGAGMILPRFLRKEPPPSPGNPR